MCSGMWVQLMLIRLNLQIPVCRVGRVCLSLLIFSLIQTSGVFEKLQDTPREAEKQSLKKVKKIPWKTMHVAFMVSFWRSIWDGHGEKIYIFFTQASPNDCLHCSYFSSALKRRWEIGNGGMKESRVVG